MTTIPDTNPVGDAYEHPADRLPASSHNGTPTPGDTPAEALPIVTAGALLATYSSLRPPIIDGLLRAGETMNVIAAPKVGKSWCTIDLLFAVATGRPWLDTFATTQGDVLLIDNELHAETSAHRLRRMAEARGISLDAIGETVHVCNLRGRLQDLYRLGMALETIESGRYRLVVIDAFYRTLPMNSDENSNGTMANLYNRVDAIADHLGAGIVLIHHSTKGSQSEKSVTDVGAGAGAQSRATDTHLVLRPHESDGVYVLDAAVRSWPPVVPRCLRWEFPLWTPATDLDPAALRSARPRRPPKNNDSAAEPPKPAEPRWDAKRFAGAFGKPEPRQRDAILDDARILMSDAKAGKLLKSAIACGNLHSWRVAGANSPMMVSTEPRPPAPVEPPPVVDTPTPAKERRRKRSK